MKEDGVHIVLIIKYLRYHHIMQSLSKQDKTTFVFKGFFPGLILGAWNDVRMQILVFCAVVEWE